MQDMQAKHQSEMDALRQDYENQLQNMKNQYEQRIIEVIGTKDGEREHMRSEMQAKIDELL